jgi:hypothetical protein
MKTRHTIALAVGLLLLGVVAAWQPAPAADDPPAKPPEPKPLPNSVRKAIGFLWKQQQSDGGFDGGGQFMVFPIDVGLPGPAPRVGGGRKPVAPAAKSDVACTSMAVLALLRSGYSLKTGDRARNLNRAMDFICRQVEASDEDSLEVTDIKGTQVQFKIGPYADTFLAAIILAEAKRKMPDEKSEKRVVTALEKIVKKMTKHQKDDGSWEGKAWAPVLSQALASRAINRAHEVGIPVDRAVLAKTADHARKQFDQLADALRKANDAPKGPKTPLPFAPGPGIGFVGPGFAPGGMVGLEAAAGVTLYATAAHVSAMMDNVATHHNAAQNARGVLASPTATEKDREEAKGQIERFGDVKKDLSQAMAVVSKQATKPEFIRGFGSDGGEEFLSFMLMGEALRATRNPNTPSWERAVTQRLVKSQNADSSWSGKHCITGSTFCTAAAILAQMPDRSPLPVIEAAGDK